MACLALVRQLSEVGGGSSCTAPGTAGADSIRVYHCATGLRGLSSISCQWSRPAPMKHGPMPQQPISSLCPILRHTARRSVGAQQHGGQAARPWRGPPAVGSARRVGIPRGPARACRAGGLRSTPRAPLVAGLWRPPATSPRKGLADGRWRAGCPRGQCPAAVTPTCRSR